MQVPVLPSVRVRAAGKANGDDAWGFAEDAGGAIALVVRGAGGAHGVAAEVADHVLATTLRIFRGRDHAILDPLAAAWWKGEHAGARISPYAALPIADRATLRDRVRALLERRTPDAIGDVVVLDAERDAVLALPERALERAADDIDRRGDGDRRWRGAAASAVCILFAAGHASIARLGQAGACHVWRIRPSPAQVTGTIAIAAGDVFVLSTRELPPGALPGRLERTAALVAGDASAGAAVAVEIDAAESAARPFPPP